MPANSWIFMHFRFHRSLLSRVIFVWFALLLSWSAAVAEPKTPAVLTDVGGYTLNSVLLEPKGRAELPPIVFIHGASTSLYDPIFSFREKLEGRAQLLFVDRPGHGRSDVGGAANTLPDGQADAIATLMEKRGIKKAIIVGHPYGGAVAAAFALNHKDKVLGLVLLSPAVYPWPGGVAWYYQAARAPVLGWVFSGLVVPAVGLVAMNTAIDAVFAPNKRPDTYISETKAMQSLQPAAFRHNAKEIANLQDWTKRVSPRYPEIKVPTIIITGDTDDIVSPEIHSRQLSRAIKGSELIVVRNLGHKSDYIANDLAVAAIEKIAGKRRNLKAIARQVEKRIAGD
ncbi:alpha/beta hydrolase [Mesorhizobium sp. SB112]|uniref:alpha/beta fold hydrolase n=1 Tax=Mesorhizobium sp. SB112 TaxID=3151853 RepID=UPI003265D299